MKLYALILFTGAMALSQARAEHRVTSAIAVTDGIGPWAQEITAKADALRAGSTYPATGYAECAPTREIPDAYLCGYDELYDMARALFRASIYIEGTDLSDTRNVPKGTLVRLDDRDFIAKLPLAASGFDLRKEHLVKFYEVVNRACRDSAGDEGVCLSPSEREIYHEVIEPAIERGGDFVVITYEIHASHHNRDRRESNYKLTVAHEVMHAQYFLQKKYRQTVEKYWSRSVSREDKDAVRDQLEEWGYDRRDELLMRNEFQAYVLQPMTEHRAFPELDRKHREPLGRALDAAGASPIQVR